MRRLPTAAPWVELLAEVLRSAPALPRGLCRAEHGIFDALDNPDTAQELCRSCPELAACGAWLESRPRDAVSGVVAGQVVRHSSNPGRPT